MCSSPDRLPLRPGSRLRERATSHLLTRLLQRNECHVQALTQLGSRVEVNQKARFWSSVVADGEASERMTLDDRMGVVDLCTRRIHTHEQEPTGSKQPRGLLEVHRDIGLGPMLEHLDSDQVIKLRHGTFECPEVIAQQT